MSRPDGAPFGWLGIFRLGLVQAALGAIVVLTTSTLNRVMVVELALPAMLPGALVALHYAVQVLRPRLGYGSDLGGRRTPWIIGGMAVLAAGGVLAALATVLMFTERTAGMVLAVLAFMMVGGGVGACGTSLLVLLAKRIRLFVHDFHHLPLVRSGAPAQAGQGAAPRQTPPASAGSPAPMPGESPELAPPPYEEESPGDNIPF